MNPSSILHPPSTPRRTGIVDDDWLTPPDLLARLGRFDLDPCSPVNRPWPTADRHFTIADDGLNQPWSGRVWLNPPYTATAAWMREHANGMALVNARTETQWFFETVWNAAWGLIFIKNRIRFYRADGSSLCQGWNASTLVAFSESDAGILYRSGIEGKFIPLIIKFAVEVRSTWRQLVRFFLRECGGVATLEQLYERVSGHPKTKNNPHWKAKVRQQVQAEARRVGAAMWKQHSEIQAA